MTVTLANRLTAARTQIDDLTWKLSLRDSLIKQLENELRLSKDLARFEGYVQRVQEEDRIRDGQPRSPAQTIRSVVRRRVDPSPTISDMARARGANNPLPLTDEGED